MCWYVKGRCWRTVLVAWKRDLVLMLRLELLRLGVRLRRIVSRMRDPGERPLLICEMRSRCALLIASWGLRGARQKRSESLAPQVLFRYDLLVCVVLSSSLCTSLLFRCVLATTQYSAALFGGVSNAGMQNLWNVRKRTQY